MASKRKRGNTWHYVVKRKGKIKPLYLTFDSEQEGDDYVARLERTLDAGIVPAELVHQSRLDTLESAIDGYMNAVHVPASDRALLGVLRGRVGGEKLSAATYPWAESFVAAMKRESGLAPSTIRHYVGALARCLDWSARNGGIPANPLRALPKRYATYNEKDAREAAANGVQAREDGERDRRLAEGEERAIRAILDGAKPDGRERPFELNHGPALRCLFGLALETGMRLRECYTLGVDQVDIARQTISLDRTKNGDKRQVPLSTVAVATIKEFLTVRSDAPGLLFPWWSGSLDDAELRRVTSLLSRQFARVFDAAGCPDFTFHMLRHEFTSRLYERTSLTDLEVAKILGWRSLRVALRYTHLRPSHFAPKLW